jgi:hypothetical protein
MWIAMQRFLNLQGKTVHPTSLMWSST